MYDPRDKKIIVSKDVLFEESEIWNWGVEVTGQHDFIVPDGDGSDNEESVHEEVQSDGTDHTLQNSPISQNNNTSGNTNEESEEVGCDIAQPNTPQPFDYQNNTTIQGERAETSRRNTKVPGWMNDYVSGEGMFEDEVDLAMFSSLEDPSVFEEAVKERQWVAAMETEMKSIMENETWELVDPPEGVKPIRVKWVYKTKFNEKGEVDKHKARLVVKGYSQKKGVDYDEIYAPVACWDTVRSILALAAQKGWVIYQLDVKCAFLNGELKETVYVQQPQGFVKKGEEHKVCKLKELYMV
ncbi:uncharacterized protein LOC143562373 [Bidens hawaiensis]|uniref:uncharacterized protein LOC143562373 n=1 Tax=Bidens hawaiensis TaxID=980011 RepID=UPI0040494D07